MASIKTKFNVGLFVIIGLCLAVVAIIWLGMSHYFEVGQLYVSYFDESVQGLAKDSPVKYRGVSIGRVDNISVAPDTNLIQVILKIESDLNKRENLVARLSSVGITGIMFIELERKTKGEPDLSPKLNFTPKYPLISTQPSDIKKILAGLDDIIKNLQAVDLGKISDNLIVTFTNLNKALEDLNIGKISSDFSSVLNKLEKVLDAKRWNKIMATLENSASNVHDFTKTINDSALKIDAIVSNNEEKVNDTFAEFQASAKKLNIAFDKGVDLVGQGETLVKDVDKRIVMLQTNLVLTLKQIEKISENINKLIESVTERPSKLIFTDDPPQERKIQ
ncbi:MAG: MCE family protein [Desulfobacterales bacterium]|nr:MCE family protein [Desulfobacterales bacterium]